MSSEARAGVPAPMATSKPPMRASASRRKAMLPPAPNGGNGNSGLCGSCREKTAGENPRPLLCPPDNSNHS